jgi:aspartyl-tRNA(Asn)/glutamyl-tRNA(Gln) amidotransferase subunit C
MITVNEVRYIADLARLQFSEAEEERMARELTRILDYIEKLDELDTEDVPPMSHVLDLYDVFRKDVVEQRISHEEALKNAPDADEDYFRVPKVIE